MYDNGRLEGLVTWELRGPDGSLKASGESQNVITQIGDQMYAERGAGVGSPPAVPTGMKLGTGSTTPAKTGAGAALANYLPNSHQAFSGTPTSGLNGAVRRITYTAVFAAGKATSASTAITEAVIVNETLTDATSLAAATVARVPLIGISSKQSTDSLTVTWTHDIGT